jgi:hypothetical protein
MWVTLSLKERVGERIPRTMVALLSPLNPRVGFSPSPPREERAGERRPIHTQVHAKEATVNPLR